MAAADATANIQRKVCLGTGAGQLAAAQLQGRREHQEDHFEITGMESGSQALPGQCLLVLADGMGGHAAGQVASQLVTRRFTEACVAGSGTIAERLEGALLAANDAVAAAVLEQPELAGMGCTLLAVVISDAGLEWLSVGDSPLWLLGDTTLQRLNDDHSMAPVIQDMVDSGRMTPVEAARDRGRNALRSAVMGKQVHLVDQSAQPLPLKPGQRLLLASDGLLTLSDADIHRFCQGESGVDVETAMELLLDAVETAARPNQDNTTAMLFEAGQNS